VFTRALHWSKSWARSIQYRTTLRGRVSKQATDCSETQTNEIRTWKKISRRSPCCLLKQVSDRVHARLLPRLSWSGSVLLPSDNIENLLRPLQLFYFRLWTYLLTLPRISLRSILILSLHLRLGLPSGSFSPQLLTNSTYALTFPPGPATCIADLIFLDLIIFIIFGADKVGCAVWGTKWFHLLKHWDRSTDICLPLFSVCVVLCR
jgi:hypothetical protein